MTDLERQLARALRLAAGTIKTMVALDKLAVTDALTFEGKWADLGKVTIADVLIETGTALKAATEAETTP